VFYVTNCIFIGPTQQQGHASINIGFLLAATFRTVGGISVTQSKSQGCNAPASFCKAASWPLRQARAKGPKVAKILQQKSKSKSRAILIKGGSYFSRFSNVLQFTQTGRMKWRQGML
jgi:hypothetical protein